MAWRQESRIALAMSTRSQSHSCTEHDGTWEYARYNQMFCSDLGMLSKVSLGHGVGDNMQDRSILVRLHRRLNSQVIRFQKAMFRYHLRQVKNRDFTLVSRNCIGGRIYQVLGLQYNTPFIGLFLAPTCFIKLANDLKSYLAQELTFVGESKYPSYRWNAGRRPYPIGLLGDVELHFMHYASESEARESWLRRLGRMNFDKLFVLSMDLTIGGECDGEHARQFDRLPFEKKVCFTANSYPELKSAIPIRRCVGATHTVDLYTDYHFFNGSFDFVKWLDA